MRWGMPLPPRTGGSPLIAKRVMIEAILHTLAKDSGEGPARSRKNEGVSKLRDYLWTKTMKGGFTAFPAARVIGLHRE
jgi:hypothetical protein